MNEEEVIDALATAPFGNTIPWGSLPPAGTQATTLVVPSNSTCGTQQCKF